MAAEVYTYVYIQGEHQKLLSFRNFNNKRYHFLLPLYIMVTSQCKINGRIYSNGMRLHKENCLNAKY